MSRAFPRHFLTSDVLYVVGSMQRDRPRHLITVDDVRGAFDDVPSQDVDVALLRLYREFRIDLKVSNDPTAGRKGIPADVGPIKSSRKYWYVMLREDQ